MTSRASRVLLITVVALVLLAVIGAVVSALRPTQQLEPGSPEASVQAYVSAVFSGDNAAAIELLDPDGPCTITDLQQADYRAPTARVVLRERTVTGERATVQVEMIRSNSATLGGSEWAEDQTFTLRKSADHGWVISDESPWPMFGCFSKER